MIILESMTETSMDRIYKTQRLLNVKKSNVKDDKSQVHFTEDGHAGYLH